jgi:HEAT repeat protein
MARKWKISAALTVLTLSLLIVAAALAQTPAPGKGQPDAESKEKASVSESQLRELIEKLSSDFFYERENAKKKLSQLGDVGATAAKSVLSSEDFRCRQAALEILALSPTNENIEAVISALRDCEISVRCTARNAIAKIGLSAIEQLEQALKSAEGREKDLLRLAAIGIYRKIVISAFNELATSLAGRGQFPGQFEKITKLGKGVTALLVEMASNPQHPYRIYAIHSLGELQDKDAIPALKKIAEDFRNDASAEAAACALYKLGEKEPLEKIVEANGGQLQSSSLALLYDRAGAYDKAEALIKQDIASGRDGPGDHFNLACVLSMQNKKEEAISELQKALEGGYQDAEWLKTDREIDNLRKEPQFKDLMKKYFPQTDLSELTKDEKDKAQKKEEEEKPPEKENKNPEQNNR